MALAGCAGVRANRQSDRVDVQGDQVRFETEKLRFVGHLSGRTLSGTVTDKRADASEGERSRDAAVLPSAGSEWSIPNLSEWTEP